MSSPGRAASSSAASAGDDRTSTSRTKITEGRVSPEAKSSFTKSWSQETSTRSWSPSPAENHLVVSAGQADLGHVHRVMPGGLQVRADLVTPDPSDI